VQADERTLHAGGQRGINVEVVVGIGGEGSLMDLGEHGCHALRRRRRRGQEAQVGAHLGCDRTLCGLGVRVCERLRRHASALRSVRVGQAEHGPPAVLARRGTSTRQVQRHPQAHKREQQQAAVQRQRAAP
jgi:hypothetical protein